MKVVIFGCQQIAVDFIDYLLTLPDVDIPLVVTYELPFDKLYGYESVLDRCVEKGLNVVSSRAWQVVESVRQVKPDVIFSVYYRKIFPVELLHIPLGGCINIHPGLLPFYRGPVPTAWAIKNGETCFGITIHNMDQGIDTGDILIQKKYSIGADETGFELYRRAMMLGAELLRRNFYALARREIAPRKQVGTGSYYGKMGDKHIIDWRNSAESIRNIVRVHAKPFSPVEAVLFNRYVLINKVRVVRDEKYVLQGGGWIVDIIDGDKLLVTCADGCLLLEDFEIAPALSEENKKDFLKVGNRFQPLKK